MADEISVSTLTDTPATDETNLDSGIDTAVEADLGTNPDTETKVDAAPKDDGEAKPFTGRIIKDGKIDPAAKAIFERIRAEFGAGAEKQLRNAQVRQEALTREFPGGLGEVRAKINQQAQVIEELGGVDGAKSTKEELAWFHDIDQQFTAGDPRFIETLVESPEGQASFLKLAPMMIEKYAAMHPEGFDSFLASKVKGELEHSDVRFGIERMFDFIQRLPEGSERNGIYDQWSKLVNFYNKVNERAQKKPESPKFAAEQSKQDDGRERQLSERENQIKQTEHLAICDSELKPVIATTLATLKKDRGLTDVQEAAAKELFDSRLGKFMARESDERKQILKFYAANDKVGYRKMVKAMFNREAPKIMSAVVDHLFPQKNGKPAAKTAMVQEKSDSGLPPQRVAPAAVGYSPIRQAPSMEQVDFNKTTMPMWSEGKAILKTGKGVTFQR